MGQLDIFTYQESGMRAGIAEGGQPWFVAVDARNVLGLKNSRDVVGRIDEDGRGNTPTSSICSACPLRT